MLSQEALQKILGIEEKVHLKAEEMADQLNITFFPYRSPAVSEPVERFAEKLRCTLIKLKTNVVPYEQALERVQLHKTVHRFVRILLNNFLFSVSRLFRKETQCHYIPWSIFRNLLRRKRVKKGISVIAVGEQATGRLPMDVTASFTESTVVTILDWPQNIRDHSGFHEHFDAALNLFAYHMTNIVIAVKKDRWLLYNFNAAHPIYSLQDDEFERAVLMALVPKIVAPIRSLKFSDFSIRNSTFNPQEPAYQMSVRDLIESGALLEQTGLYPKGKRIDELPFRNAFYRWVGRIHLDQRSGMSYGFLARQLPIVLSPVIPFEEFVKRNHTLKEWSRDFLFVEKKLFLIVELPPIGKFVLSVPDVAVLSQRSGCDKTCMNPQTDLMKLTLSTGKLILETPTGVKVNEQFKPSFDTRVILAHAVGNTIIASLLGYFDPTSEFARQATEAGFAIAHWHGYFHPKHIPKGWYVHGIECPHVACSSPQSALYALEGKLQAFKEVFAQDQLYRGDIHIEPHHGTNITFPTLKALSEFLLEDRAATVLGNSYLALYNSPYGDIS